MGMNNQIRTQAKGRNRKSPKGEQPHLPRNGLGLHRSHGRPIALRRIKRLPLNISFLLYFNEFYAIVIIGGMRKNIMVEM